MKRINTAYTHIIVNKLYTKEQNMDQNSKGMLYTEQTGSKSPLKFGTVKGVDGAPKPETFTFSCPWCHSSSTCTCEYEIGLFQKTQRRQAFTEIFARLQIYVRWSQSFSNNSEIELKREWDEQRISSRLEALLAFWQRSTPPDWRERLCLFVARILHDCHRIGEAISYQQGCSEPLKFTADDFLSHSKIEELLDSYERGLVIEAWNFLEEKRGSVVH